MKRNVWIILLAIGGIILFTFDPSVSALFPKCPFLMLTGLQCPGCGSQRAIHALLHLDIMAALHYNALLVLSLPLILALLYAEWKRNSNPKLYVRIHHPAVIWSCFGIIVLWWIGRDLWAFLQA